MPTYVVDKAPAIGTQGAQPASGSITMTINQNGPNLFTMNFVFAAARLTVTDGAASGSSGSLKIFDFKDGVIHMIGSRHNWTAFAEGTALTTAAGDAVHQLAFGSTAATVGDGTLTGTMIDFGGLTGTITNSGGTGTAATKVTTIQTPLDGTATAVDLYVNWSGTAATIDATSTIDITGTYTVLVSFLGDD